MNYPKKAKAFYMKENPDNPETVLCADSSPGRLRRDHRRFPARRYSRKAPGPDPSGELPEEAVRLGTSTSEVRVRAALRLRDRAGTHPRLDLRHAAHQGVHPVPADQWGGSTLEREPRAPGRSSGSTSITGHMDGLVKMAHEHPQVNLAGVCDEQPAAWKDQSGPGDITPTRVVFGLRKCMEATEA